MSRVRSPNFPVIGLPQAIDRIEAIYDKEQTLTASRETIAEHLGYSGLNGASLKLISALGKYGLLEAVEGKGFRVSKLAMAILHPANDQEKSDAIREAATLPALFQKLNDQFEGGRPSETNLRSWLLRNGFAKSAVDSVIRAYGETMELVGDSRKGYNSPDAKQDNFNPPALRERQASNMTTATMASPPHQMANSEPFSIELMKNRFRVVGELTTKADAQRLVEMIQLALNFLPDKAAPLFAENGDQSQALDWDDEEDA